MHRLAVSALGPASASVVARPSKTGAIHPTTIKARKASPQLQAVLGSLESQMPSSSY